MVLFVKCYPFRDTLNRMLTIISVFSVRDYLLIAAV